MTCATRASSPPGWVEEASARPEPSRSLPAGTLANLLAVEGAPETFWREAHSRNKDVNGPSRGLIGTAMTSAVCRRRLGLRERTKRLVELVEKKAERLKAQREAAETVAAE